uniref:PsbP C-terminal domain-containing protein n=1 Tax=Corethron hystrix TaxID=216773 RepID=A0A7S1BT66_9STRA
MISPRRKSTRALLLLLATDFASAFSPSAPARHTSSTSLAATPSRREAVASLAAGSLAFVLPAAPALAAITDETPRVVTRMGGLLEKYGDPLRGFVINCPSGWNKFEGEVGAYDIKWQDVVSIEENLKISSTPVKSTTTSIEALGEVKAVGESLAAKRNAKLLMAEDRLTEGVLFYTFEFALPDNTHQMLQLSVNKGKIWSLDANASEKRWPKRAELYKNAMGSFVPKLL